MRFSQLLLILAVLINCLAAQTGSSNSTSPGNSTGLTASDVEARKHYKIAVVALKNNDLHTAEAELLKASDLAPHNALMFYNLALVQFKEGNIGSADKSLQIAEDLKVPSGESENAANLRAEIDYKKLQGIKQEQAQREEQESVDALSWLIGEWSWNTNKDSRIGCVSDIVLASTTAKIVRTGNSLSGSIYDSLTVRVSSDGSGCTYSAKVDQCSYVLNINSVVHTEDPEKALLNTVVGPSGGNACTLIPGSPYKVEARRNADGTLSLLGKILRSNQPTISRELTKPAVSTDSEESRVVRMFETVKGRWGLDEHDPGERIALVFGASITTASDTTYVLDFNGVSETGINGKLTITTIYAEGGSLMQEFSFAAFHVEDSSTLVHDGNVHWTNINHRKKKDQKREGDFNADARVVFSSSDMCQFTETVDGKQVWNLSLQRR